MKKICLIVALIGLFVINIFAIDGINEDFSRISYKTPIPATVKYPFFNDYKSLIDSVGVKYCKWSTNTVVVEGKDYNYPVEMTQAEKDAVDQAEADAQAARQAEIDAYNAALAEAKTKQDNAEAEIIAIANNYGYTNIPLVMLDVRTELSNYMTNVTTLEELKSLVDDRDKIITAFTTYILNGGDKDKVGIIE